MGFDVQEADEDEDEGEELSEDGENKVGGIVREYLSEFPPRIHQGGVVALSANLARGTAPCVR